MAGSVPPCSSNGASIRATSRTPTSSPTRRAGRLSTWTPGRRSSRCGRRRSSGGSSREVVLRTHSHADHVEHEGELGLPVETGAAEVGGLRVEALPTPGHSDDMVAFVVNGEAVFTGDTLFKDSVGGGNFEQVRQSVMDVLMKLPPETRVLPGHTDETTIGREWEENPFIRVWRGVEPEGNGARARRGRGRDADRLVAGLRRRRQGLGSLRRRPRRDRRRLPRRADLVAQSH